MEYMRQIDIIVPVYNAYDSVVKCIESVLAYTDFSNVRVVVIDDKSTDEHILPYLREIALRYAHVILLENEQNIGFVRSVNRALDQSAGDVVLLNSDTIVGPDWLYGLHRTAFSSDKIGTVTPLSNNGSHCSVPMFAHEGDTLEETIARTQERIRTTSLHKYPDIGVGVGFCMYIRREVLNEVGNLDAEKFGHGYGEEVDFCLKAEQMGYQNVLCDDVFIYHEGTASFSLKTKNKNVSIGDSIIRKQYPQQYSRALQIAAAAAKTDWYQNFELYRSISNNRKNLLYLLQADFREDSSNNVGGTQFHVKDLTMALKNRYNIFVMARDRDYLRLTIYIDEKRISFKFYIGTAPQFAVYHDPAHMDLYMDILKAFRIDIVHIHHTYSLTLDLYHAASALSIPLLASLHDYYTLCPTIFLLENKTTFCGNRTCETNCNNCLDICSGISPKLNYIAKWRKEHLKALKKCDRLFAPSESAKKTFLQYYPELAEKVDVIPHGINPVYESYEQYTAPVESDDLIFNIESTDVDLSCGKFFGWAYLTERNSEDSSLFLLLSSPGKDTITIPLSSFHRGDLAVINPKYGRSGFSISFPVSTLESGQWKIRVAIRNGDVFVCSRLSRNLQVISPSEKKLNVAFIGGLSQEKGSQNIYKMIKQGNRNVNWFLFGGIGDRELAMLEQPNLFKTSWYRREDLKQLFELYRIDMVCILPIVAETFCYTLSEAISCNRPVLVSDIGALGERMREMGCGWILPANATTKERLDKIEQIRLDPQILLEASEKAAHYHHRTVPEMALDYECTYENYPIYAGSGSLPQNTQQLYQGYLLGEQSQTYTTENMIALQNRISLLENQIALIENSTGYKAVMAFRRMRFPFKDTLKRFVCFCYRIAKQLHIA